MTIKELLGPVSLCTFLEEHYLKLPFARSGGCSFLTHLGDWQVLERILAHPEADSRASRNGGLWEGGRIASVQTARELLAEGYTLGVRHAERQDPTVAELADGFQRDFLAPVDVHLYVTPTGQPGLGWHYDAEEVFVLQLRGVKEWQLRKNTVNPWPLIETLPANMRHEREIMPLLRCVLQAGDWLYIPGGYWHRTAAGAAEESASLSVGLMPACAIDAFDFLRRELLASLRWRQRLPVIELASGTSAVEQIEAHRERFAELGRDLADLLSQESTARAFLKERTARFFPESSRPGDSKNRREPA